MNRARGRAYECACGEEKLRLTRSGPDARHDGWVYLFGKCGGGVKLRFTGAKVVEWKSVDDLEIARVKTLPVRKLTAFESMIEKLDDKQREKLDALVGEIREALREGMKQFLVVAKLLADAKHALRDDHGAFTLWVRHNGLDPVHAHKFIAIHEAARSSPALSQTFVRIGQEKSVLLTRLPDAKRTEVIEDGVLVDGKRKPLDDVSFRELNAYVRSIIGKSARGRKAKAGADEKPTERFGLPLELADPLQAVLRGLHALQALAKKHGIQKKHRVPAGRLWQRVYVLTQKLHHDHRFGELLDDA
jgi:hypothetical protein